MDDNKQYLTVKQFAQAIEKSDKAVYKQLSTRLKDYVITVEGRKLIDTEALYRFYGIKWENGKVQPGREEVSNSVNNSTEEFNRLLEEKQARIDEMQGLIDDLRTSLERERMHADRYVAEASNWRTMYWEAHSKLLAIEDKQQEEAADKAEIHADPEAVEQDDNPQETPAAEKEQVKDETPQDDQERVQDQAAQDPQISQATTAEVTSPKKKWWQRLLGL